MSACGTKQTSSEIGAMSAFDPKRTRGPWPDLRQPILNLDRQSRTPVSRDASFLAIDLLRRTRLVWVFSLNLLSEKLRQARCDDTEIGSITGMSPTMIRRCLRFADQKRLAKSAPRRLEQHANAEKL